VIGTQGLVIPGYSRGTVWANAVTGAQDFTTEVTSSEWIIADRAMYWPSGSSLLSGGGEMDVQSAAPTAEPTAVTEAEASPPWLDTGGGPPQP
jgi:hypothetical protein